MGTPRMTTAKSFRGEPAAAGCTVALQSLECICGARGHVPAGRDTPGEESLIATHTRREKARDGTHQRVSEVKAARDSGFIRVVMVRRSVVCDQSSRGAVTRIR